MKVSCSQAALARGLATVQRAVATRSTLPILSNILLETEEDRLKMSATNLEIGISCWIDAAVRSPGSTTVPARLLSDFINSLPEGEVDMDLNGRNQTLKLSSDRYKADIRGISADDFNTEFTQLWVVPAPIRSNTITALNYGLGRGRIVEKIVFKGVLDHRFHLGLYV